MTDREVVPGCARMRTKCAEKMKCWSVGTDYVLEKLPDVSGPGLVEAGRYRMVSEPGSRGFTGSCVAVA